MVVEINENILLALAGLIFIPVFIFSIKMIIEQGNTRGKLEAMEDHIKESKPYYERINKLENDNNIQSLKLNRLEKDYDNLKNKVYGSSVKGGPFPRE